MPLLCRSPAPQDTGLVLHSGILPPSSGGRAAEPPANTSITIAIHEGPRMGQSEGSAGQEKSNTNYKFPCRMQNHLQHPGQGPAILGFSSAAPSTHPCKHCMGQGCTRAHRAAARQSRLIMSRRA